LRAFQAPFSRLKGDCGHIFTQKRRMSL